MEHTLQQEREICEVGYTRYSGIELTAFGKGFAEGKMVITEHHQNPGGAVHGGAIFCLGDVIGGIAFRGMGGPPVTLSSNITYFRPMLDDQVIYARAEVIKFGKTTAFIEISILNEEKTECARIAATYYNLKGRVKHEESVK